MRIFAVSATFFCSFPAFELGLGCCFADFYGFSYFFPGLFRLLGWGLGAVWGISAVSATFFLVFFGFLARFGVLFGKFLRFQLHKTNLLCYQPMAIVHYDNLKIQYFLNKKTKKVNFQKNKNNYCSRFIGALPYGNISTQIL